MIFFQNKNFNSILFLSLFNFLFFIIFFIYSSNKFYKQIEILEQNLNLIKNEVVL